MPLVGLHLRGITQRPLRLVLVDDILNLGQAEARRLIPAKAWISAETIVRETEAIMRAAAAAQDLTLDVDAEPAYPSCTVIGRAFGRY